METGTRRERIERVLWPAGAAARSVWAVLDLARDRRIHAALIESRLESLCLYSGRLAPALEAAAPHMVELLPGHRLTTRLIDEGLGQAWGVFVRIDDASNLRHHLRKFLKVQDEDGRRLLFRWYDPRVLRAYLPTCTADECRQVFGPIERWFAESDDGESLLEFGFDGSALRQKAWPLA
jgi:Domain of unknown function (DUF4123)